MAIGKGKQLEISTAPDRSSSQLSLVSGKMDTLDTGESRVEAR